VLGGLKKMIHFYEMNGVHKLKKVEDLMNNIEDTELDILIDSRGWVVDGNHRLSALYYLGQIEKANFRKADSVIEPYEYEEEELKEMFEKAETIEISTEEIDF
jgi:hypothetical protein